MSRGAEGVGFEPTGDTNALTGPREPIHLV
jgi:hypothetical protein